MHKIYTMIKRACIRLIDFVNNIRYKIDFKLVCKSWLYNYKLINFKNCNVLFLVPHADDDLIGGYGLSKKCKGDFIYGYFGLTGSNKDIDNKKTRDLEFKTYCNRTDTPFLLIHDVDELISIVVKKHISQIFLPTIVDWHSEHRLLNYYLYDALEMLKGNDVEIIWYSVSVPICYNDMEIVPLTKQEQSEKYRLFKNVYLSQKHMPIRRFIYQERINANGTKYYAGESFLRLDRSIWKQVVRYVRNYEKNSGIVNELNQLSGKINGIKNIREVSQKIYDKLLDGKDIIV